MSLKKLYIGSICFRDLEIFEEIRLFLKLNYNIKVINLIPYKGLKKGQFDLKYFCKKLKKYPILFIIVKVFSEEANEQIYRALREFAPKIPLLNSLQAVQTCESRKATFKLIEEKCKKINVPRTFYSIEEALKACKKGTDIIIKLDVHNIPNLPRENRIIGIARNPCEFNNLVKKHDPGTLFFQEYLPKATLIYKVYVIDRWIVSITAQDIMRDEKLTPLKLIHIRVPIDKELKRRILKLGRKFGMSIYGIDYISDEEGVPCIIDVNDFPSFRYIPEAISLISDYIYEYLNARQKITGKMPMYLKSRTYTA
ncbi:MAG: hypothetical protein EU539_09120 [Promethearchaeota archaeon]|nr:MAG: hypothetical protein EU539_09120 [Candidatus Lokiarchaeota archaeon]